MPKGGNASKFTGRPETFQDDPLIAPFTRDPAAAQPVIQISEVKI